MSRDAPLQVSRAACAKRRAGELADSRHFAECARVAAVLERRYPHCRVIGEGELRREERLRGGPLASASLSHDQRTRHSLHRPDLVVWPPACQPGLPVAIEVELSPKAAKYLSRICRAWKRCQLVDCVLYVAAAAVERPLRRTIAAVDAGERVIVIPLVEMVGRTTRQRRHPCRTPTSTASSS
ncbi:MAG: hypothetical protein ACTHM1_12385 [Solirubrobacteraceae bacterium]